MAVAWGLWLAMEKSNPVTLQAEGLELDLKASRTLSLYSQHRSELFPVPSLSTLSGKEPL